MADEQVAPELKPIKTKLEGIIGELKQLQGSGTPTEAQVTPGSNVDASLREVDAFCAFKDCDACRPNTLGCTLQLSPVHEQLRGIDEMYVDEKFEINGTCPAGQAVCADLLSEAHELVESIQEQIPDEDDE